MINTAEIFAGLSPVLAEAAPSAPGGSSMLIWMILLFVGMWFLMIAPQRKAQKQHQKLIAGLKKGDRIITKGGFYGKILAVKKDRVTLLLGDSAKVELVKGSIASVIGEDAEGKTQEEEIEQIEENNPN